MTSSHFRYIFLLTLPVAAERFQICCRIGCQLISDESGNSFSLCAGQTLIGLTWKKWFLLSSKVCEITDEIVKAPHYCGWTVADKSTCLIVTNKYQNECYGCKTVSIASLRNKRYFGIGLLFNQSLSLKAYKAYNSRIEPGAVSLPGSSTSSWPTYRKFQHLRVTVSLGPEGHNIGLLTLYHVLSICISWSW